MHDDVLWANRSLFYNNNTRTPSCLPLATLGRKLFGQGLREIPPRLLETPIEVEKEERRGKQQKN
jgi:hypothetical protein